jgi:PKD repeat protein
MRLATVMAMATLAACGGGGGGGGSGNTPPTASFTASPVEGPAPLTVNFDASASADPDGSIVNYVWNFGDNGSGSGATVSHAFVAAGTFTVTLTVTDNGGARTQATRTITVSAGPPPTSVTVSGRITYDRVPFEACVDTVCRDGTFADGLDYAGTIESPARGVTVELVKSAGGEIIATTSADANGSYSVTAPVNTSVFVRAKAQSVAAGTSANPAAWSLRVLDNFGDAKSLYAISGATFDTGITNHTRNLRAASGWGGFAGYTSERAAAPFAILDTLYSAVQFLVAKGDRSVKLGPLDVFWSPENRPTDDWNPARGWIGTTAYRTGASAGTASPGIYVLGAADNDIDEYDQHIIAHEFQHFLEDALSRADTPGGPHGLDEKLDLRLAFSEGFANAFAAMALGDPVYRDAFGTGQSQVFRFNMETAVASNRGWYNETSVHGIVWDLYDGGAEAGDAVELGYGPMYEVFVRDLRDGIPLTSVFAFVTALRARVPATAIAGIEARVQAENIVAGTIDAWGSTETNSGVTTAQRDLVLPIYADVALNGSPVRLCGDTVVGTYNKIGNRRFVRFAVPGTRTIDIQVTCLLSDSTCTGNPQPDPDFGLYHGRSVEFAESDTPFTESLRKTVEAGQYVLEVYEYSHADPDVSSQRRGRTCMTVRITG